MSTSNGFAMNLRILDGKNFDHWSIQMKAIFGFQECLDIVQEGVQPIEDNSTEAQKLEFRDAKKRDCKIEEQETIAEYFTRIRSLINLMKGCGEQISEQSIVEKILRTLAARFDHVIDELQGSLEAHEQRFLERVSDRQSQQALSAQFKRRNLMHNDKHKKSSGRWQGENKYGNEKSIHNGQGFLKDSSDNQSYEADTKNEKKGSSQESGRRKKDKSKIQCFNCKNWGHFALECKLRRRSKEAEARLAKDEDSDEEVLLLC
ncbi:PREDICTED: uncharacterized protein LOC109327685 [Lupinus angustifolius]|uniref:uncharacterized protein LOC109327685 n=1 Tax=Lupinus angustifolius TaxID=3871 RepID=UPI00092FA7BB|nr:PREDICTED: uncharacterized protein LOC109327685 [Lupinus angustifolius]